MRTKPSYFVAPYVARTAAGGKSDGMEDVEGTDCVICLSEARDTTVLPCRHMCMCHDCARAVQAQANKCPVCRAPMESLLHIKIQNKARPASGGGAPAAAAAAAGSR